jgi:hypothetical protein
VGPWLCLAVAWAAWTIKPTLNRNEGGPGFIPGFFLVPSNNFFGLLLRRLKLKMKSLAESAPVP